MDTRGVSTIKEFAKRNHLCRSSVYEESKRGRLKISKVGSRSLIFVEDEEAWRASLPTVHKAPTA